MSSLPFSGVLAALHAETNIAIPSVWSWPAGFSACVTFKDPGPSPVELGSSSFSVELQIKQTRLAKQKPQRSDFPPSVWPDTAGEEHSSLSRSGPNGSARLLRMLLRQLQMFTHVLHVLPEGQRAASSIRTFDCLWTPPSCAHLWPGLAELFSHSDSLQAPKGPTEGLYYPLSKWTEGDHRTRLSCSGGNPTPAGLFERPGKQAQESCGLRSLPLRYLQSC